MLFAHDYIGHIMNIFQTDKGSDIIIECKEHQFNVHKFILITFSPVFQTMVCFSSISKRLKYFKAFPCWIARS